MNITSKKCHCVVYIHNMYARILFSHKTFMLNFEENYTKNNIQSTLFTVIYAILVHSRFKHIALNPPYLTFYDYFWLG